MSEGTWRRGVALTEIKKAYKEMRKFYEESSFYLYEK